MNSQLSCLPLSSEAGLVFSCPKDAWSVIRGDARICSRYRKSQHSLKSYQLRNLEKYIINFSLYQGFNIFHLSLSCLGASLSYRALNFLESTYMCLSGLLKILYSHLNCLYQGFNIFHLSLSCLGASLSYRALNFLESTYMCLSGLLKILYSHLNYTGLWG